MDKNTQVGLTPFFSPRPRIFDRVSTIFPVSNHLLLQGCQSLFLLVPKFGATTVFGAAPVQYAGDTSTPHAQLVVVISRKARATRLLRAYDVMLLPTP